MLSLFDQQIPWLGEGPSTKPFNLPSEGPSHLIPHPQNAPGAFYVGHGECITCGAPHTVAPDLIGWDDSPNEPGIHRHCYFKKQPGTPEELDQALAAINSSCCGALYYAGSDPRVLQDLRKNGNEHAIVGEESSR